MTMPRSGLLDRRLGAILRTGHVVLWSVPQGEGGSSLAYRAVFDPDDEFRTSVPAHRTAPHDTPAACLVEICDALERFV